MATSKKKAKKNVKAETSKYYIVKTVQDAKSGIRNRAETYKERYIEKPVEVSREFVEDLKNDPRSVIEDLIGDGRDFVEDLTAESRDKIDVFVSDGKDFFKKMRKNPRKVMDEFIDDGQEFFSDLKNDTKDRFEEYVNDGKGVFEGIEKDVRLAWDDVVANSKKVFDKKKVKKTIEDKINNSMKTFTNRLNMPSKNEVENLMAGIDALNKKVETMSKTYNA